MKKLIVAIALSTFAAACRGGDMGNTRGGGAAPGQSGGRDTSGAAATAAPSQAVPGGSAVGASAAATRAGADTSKVKKAAKQP